MWCGGTRRFRATLRSYLAQPTTDSAVVNAAKMVPGHYPKGRCIEHPDLPCANWENLHFELNDIRCQVWGNKIVCSSHFCLDGNRFDFGHTCWAKPPSINSLSAPFISNQQMSSREKPLQALHQPRPRHRLHRHPLRPITLTSLVPKPFPCARKQISTRV